MLLYPIFASVLVVGLLAAWLGRGLQAHARPRGSAGAAKVSVAVVALSGALLASPTDLPGEAFSWHGAVHGVGFVLLLLGCAAAADTSGLALRGAPGWRGYWVYSVITGTVALLLATALGSLGQLTSYLTIAVLLGWFAVMGSRLRQLARAESAAMPEGAAPSKQAGERRFRLQDVHGAG